MENYPESWAPIIEMIQDQCEEPADFDLEAIAERVVENDGTVQFDPRDLWDAIAENYVCEGELTAPIFG